MTFATAASTESGFEIETWTKDSPEYPRELLDLKQPPTSLFAIGKRDVLDSPRVSVVGTRSSTGYGERIARTLGLAFARAGVTVISGMARGIDSKAHRTALEQGTGTVAVLGTGIDVPYPVGHRALHRSIAMGGLVLSENPPGTIAYQGAFPRRNRIIAALSPLTIVVEAGYRSGAINTATQALELGRQVAAVPGPIDSEQSKGTNQLIKDGSEVITSPADALALLGITIKPESPPPLLPDTEQKVWDSITAGSALTDDLPALTDLTLAECLAAITSLEIMGLVECTLAGEIKRR
ncbi:MAG: DNA protecting protein DprA [Gemmatimonas sp. 13_1_20CM_3_60_15]|nr:MAG: DNA protecting protein DprA [Gemmatimonas sp. 13_1_20CM_3_60_15]